MAASAVEDALDAIRTDLLGIDATNLYTYSVVEVHRDVVDPRQKPAIVMVPGRLIPGGAPSNLASNYRRFYALPLRLIGHLETTDTARTIDTQLWLFEADIRLAMTSPTTHRHNDFVLETIHDGSEVGAIEGNQIGAVVADYTIKITDIWSDTA